MSARKPVVQSTASQTEAQFAGEVRAAIKQAFPLLGPEEIFAEPSFSFTFGHATVTVKAKLKASARARADILITRSGRPLAVMELKRPGAGLTRQDELQGLSYARVLDPMPPLVVVTDGAETRLLGTYTGQRLAPESASEEGLAALLGSAAAAAAGDLKRAVATLMGTDPDVWMQAIRQATAATIEEMSGEWRDHLSPFVKGLLFPRKATLRVQRALEKGARSVIAGGAPLSGKSSLLRELASLWAEHASFAVLYLDADSRLDLFQTLADQLSATLDWRLNSDEARQWLVGISKAAGPALVLAIDNLAIDHEALRRDLETVTSNMFGPGVRVVLAVDGMVAAKLVLTRNGRLASPLGKRSERFGLPPLDLGEFEMAEVMLQFARMKIMRGGAFSPELRKPWVLRAVGAEFATMPQYSALDRSSAIPPTLGLDLFEFVRRRFGVTSGSNARYRELAQALLEDLRDIDRPKELAMEQKEAFVVRREAARKHLTPTEIAEMSDAGLLREGKSLAGDSVYVARLPELLASEVARLVADDLVRLDRTDPDESAKLLVAASLGMPLGDLVAAQALIDAMAKNGGLNLEIIGRLLDRPPKREILPSGTRVRLWLKGVGFVEATLLENGSIRLENGTLLEGEGGAEHVAYADLDPWLILSHVAGRRIAIAVDGETTYARVDPAVLEVVATCTMPLRGLIGEESGLTVHEVSPDLAVVCPNAGVVEPITRSLTTYLVAESEADADAFVDAAAQRADPATLARLDAALRQISELADKSKSAWAQRVRREKVEPAFPADLRASLWHE